MNGVVKPLLFTLWLQAGAKFFPSLTRTHTHTHTQLKPVMWYNIDSRLCY